MESIPKGGSIAAEAEGSSPSSTLDVQHRSLRAVADLQHPHLVPMRRASTGPGYEVEPPVGISLSDLSSDGRGSPALRVRVRILLDALSGLAALHRAKADGKPINFVHGEVAPHNVVVASDGIGRLIPLVESHWSSPPLPAQASLGYVAPERLLGDVFDQRADIFSIGVLLWEAIAERRLFHNLRMDAIVTQLVGNKVSRPPAPPDAPWADALADVAMQALAVDPADRWPHVGVMGAEIETIAQGFLPSSNEIASILRQRSGDRTSSIPMSDRPTYHPDAYGPGAFPGARGSAPPGFDANAGRASVLPGSVPNPAAAVIWHGPTSVQSAPDRSRDSFRPSSPAVSTRSRRNSREVVQRQSRIVWTAVGVGVALFGIAGYELMDRDAPGPSTTTASARPPGEPEPRSNERHAALTPPAVVPRPTPPVANSAPAETPAIQARATIDAGRTATRSAAPVVAAPSPRPQAPTPRSNPAPTPPPVASPPPAPPVVTAAPPAPEPPPEPPAPKPKEDPFGI